MRNNRERWSFCEVPSRDRLTAEQVIYWKKMLKRLLKVGMEFEFNLPEKKNGSCRGDSDCCPCQNLSLENTCWQKCINNDGCPTPTSHGSNQGEQTTTTCAGIFCPNFVSYCCICTEYTRDCKSCEYMYDPSKNPDAIRKTMKDELRPNNTYGQVNASGVHSIVTDGSLLGKKGVEIVTVGRRVDYWEFFKMSSKILDLARAKGAYLNERCSTHMHVLASYYSKLVSENQEEMGVPLKVNEMERNMPEIILANLHQLVRRYQNAMTWMMMGLSEPERMTRWEKFRVSVLPISAVMNHMRNVRDEVSSHAGGNKYGWINYNNIAFDERTGDVHRMHVEFRAADGMYSPSAIAAIGCMYYALTIKAVETSRYGILTIEDEDWLDHAQAAKTTILNNMKHWQDGDRFADTREIGKYQDVFMAEALDLARQLKATLIDIGPAFEVLEKLAERPCALRLCDGQTWEEIEEDLKVIVTEEGRFETELSEIIVLNQISECKNEAEWINEVGRVLRGALEIDPDNAEVEDDIRNYVERNKEEGRMVWSNRIGAPIMI